VTRTNCAHTQSRCSCSCSCRTPDCEHSPGCCDVALHARRGPQHAVSNGRLWLRLWGRECLAGVRSRRECCSPCSCLGAAVAARHRCSKTSWQQDIKCACACQHCQQNALLTCSCCGHTCCLHTFAVRSLRRHPRQQRAARADSSTGGVHSSCRSCCLSFQDAWLLRGLHCVGSPTRSQQ
jgi:hypothetical protein